MMKVSIWVKSQNEEGKRDYAFLKKCVRIEYAPDGVVVTALIPTLVGDTMTDLQCEFIYPYDRFIMAVVEGADIAG